MNPIEVVNLVPEFLTFYDKANQPHINDDERFELWKKHYNFAAIPPGEEGQRMAREMLDAAWDQYAENLSYLKDWSPDTSNLERMLQDVKEILEHHRPVDLTVIYFVGCFENNPFVAPHGKGVAVCLPVECGESDIFLAHELTHIVHGKTAGLTHSWERTIASTVIREGLATRVSECCVPGKEVKSYLEFSEGWLEACEQHESDILEGIVPFLESSSSEHVMRFTIGKGTAGIEREAYFTGWKVVGVLLDQGATFSEIARINEAEMPDYVKRVISCV